VHLRHSSVVQWTAAQLTSFTLECGKLPHECALPKGRQLEASHLQGLLELLLAQPLHGMRCHNLRQLIVIKLQAGRSRDIFVREQGDTAWC
jgi:hypothetical protein